MNKKDDNHSILNGVCEFVNLLLKEVLDKRCDFKELFYLPGLPVMEEELIFSMTEGLNYAQSTSTLKNMWKSLLEVIKTNEVDTDSSRMTQLCYLYELNELWIFSIVITYAYRCAPKYEKSFLLLQGDTKRSKPDAFLICALAHYIGIEYDVTQLITDSRIKNELFENLYDSQFCLREYVYLWLCQQDDIKLYKKGIMNIHSGVKEQSVIRSEELDWCLTVARRQLEEKIENQLIFELKGRIGAGKKFFCREVSKRLGYRLCEINMSILLEKSDKELEDILQEIHFKCMVNGCLLYLNLHNCTEESSDVTRYVREILSEYTLVFIGVDPKSTIVHRLALSAHQISFEKISLKESLSLWKCIGKKYLVEENLDYEQLAGRYRLLPGAIEEVFKRAERYRFEKCMENIDFPLLLSCIRESNQVISNSLMERIDTVFKWEDLRVEPQVIHGMQLACAHLKYRFTMHQNIGQHYPYGSGVGVLMYGPPGTGKTMAAQVIANELQMDLYRVDLSQVSSKYIGETEKNLEQIFKEAEQANVILFFDEADSMFGKRTEVKDSNDKYANQETSYILQRIESYDGMVILATNFAQNFDSAFMRRITVSINFSMPDEATRKLLWKDMLKHSDLVNDSSTIDALAYQFELTGSNIKNIVRNAEFLALMSGRKLSITDIVMAIKIEYEKLGKICNSATFGMFMMYTY